MLCATNVEKGWKCCYESHEDAVKLVLLLKKYLFKDTSSLDDLIIRFLSLKVIVWVWILLMIVLQIFEMQLFYCTINQQLHQIKTWNSCVSTLFQGKMKLMFTLQLIVLY